MFTNESFQTCISYLESLRYFNFISAKCKSYNIAGTLYEFHKLKMEYINLANQKFVEVDVVAELQTVPCSGVLMRVVEN